jgi:hypothetical protein
VRRPVNQATIYAPPVVVDLDADGELEVVVGTGLGFLYRLRVISMAIGTLAWLGFAYRNVSDIEFPCS